MIVIFSQSDWLYIAQRHFGVKVHYERGLIRPLCIIRIHRCFDEIT